jgi:hypothetical protein
MEKQNPYVLPPAERLRQIEAKQDEQAKRIKARRAEELQRQTTKEQQATSNAQSHAAEVIQRNYRGYRDRRALKGFGLDPSTRWIEAIKEGK